MSNNYFFESNTLYTYKIHINVWYNKIVYAPVFIILTWWCCVMIIYCKHLKNNFISNQKIWGVKTYSFHRINNKTNG